MAMFKKKSISKTELKAVMAAHMPLPEYKPETERTDMASFNKIIIVGYLGRDPELKYTPQGKAVTDFSVATTEKSGDREHTTWFRCTAWEKTAELVANFLKKGSMVYVEGPLKMTEYTAKDGTQKQSLEVRVREVQFLDRKGESAPAENQTDQIRKSAGLPKVTEDVPF